MTNKAKVSDLARSLQDAGAINMDMKVGDLLKVDGIGDIDPTSPVAATVVAWDGYAVILPSGKEQMKEVIMQERMEEVTQKQKDIIDTQKAIKSLQENLANLQK